VAYWESEIIVYTVGEEDGGALASSLSWLGRIGRSCQSGLGPVETGSVSSYNPSGRLEAFPPC
jgi:hypothetical protein